MRRGFTLVELMVVVLVLGLLAAAIVPKVAHRSTEAKRAKAQADLASIGAMLDQFRNDVDRFPTQSEGLEALVARPQGVKNWQGPYLSRLPFDPWGNRYEYDASKASEPSAFRLVCLGSDGAAGGEGDAEDLLYEGGK